MGVAKVVRGGGYPVWREGWGRVFWDVGEGGVFADAGEAKAGGDHACVGEKRDGVVGSAEVGR